MNELLDFLKITGPWAAGLLGGYLLLNVIGEIVEKAGKIVPEFFKIRKFFKRKKEEKQSQKTLIKDVQTLLAEVNAHYSADNIAKRDSWMLWVNERAIVYDESVTELKALKESLELTNKLTLDLYINANRHRILDFASKVANETVVISREEFNRIFKIHKEYHAILEQYNMTNGEVDIAFKVIEEAYEERLKDHSFLEDQRGYN